MRSGQARVASPIRLCASTFYFAPSSILWPSFRGMKLAQHLTRSLFILAVLGVATTLGLAQTGQSEKIYRFGIDQGTGIPNAVVVEDAPLAHTAQLLPLNQQGQLVGQGAASRQIDQVLNNLA